MCLILLLLCSDKLTPSFGCCLCGVPHDCSTWNVVLSGPHNTEKHPACHVGFFSESICDHLAVVDVADLLDGGIIVNGLSDVENVRLEPVVTAGREVVYTAPQVLRVN